MDIYNKIFEKSLHLLIFQDSLSGVFNFYEFNFKILADDC